MKDPVGFVALIASMLWAVWGTAFWCVLYLRAFLPERTIAVARWVFFEGRPFAPLLIVAMHPAMVGVGGWGWLLDGINVVIWLAAQTVKDDDDRWKRRRKKLAEKVRRHGTRLVVVPATAGAP